MKILFSGHHNPHFPTITEYLERAIQILGHELFVFEDRQHTIPGRIRERWPLLHRLDMTIINTKMLTLARTTKPDLAIVTGGTRISSNTIDKLISCGIECILWTTDPPMSVQPLLSAAPFYNHIFCLGTEAVELFERFGVKGAQWLPMACDPEYHHPVTCTAEDEKTYGSDIVFVGSYYPNRVALFEKLSDFDLAIWGPGWDALDRSSPLRRCIRGAHTVPADWLKIYSASKIVLATHYQDHQNRFPVYQASPRIFEVLACRAFLMCDDQRDVFSIFLDGIDLVRFLDATDMVNKLKYYLAHPEERKRIAAQGRETVLARHTYQDRIKDLMKKIGHES